MGEAIGQTFKPQFHEYLLTSDLYPFLLPYYETPGGKDVRAFAYSFDINP